MDHHHCFVSLLDIGEILPFTVNADTKDFSSHMSSLKGAESRLIDFVRLIQKNMGERIYHVGTDVINDKSYHRFMFQNSGFLEIVVHAPAVINAHFHSKKRASDFASALKKTITKAMPDDRKRELLLRSITVEDEHSIPLKIKDLKNIRNIRSVLQRSATLMAVSIFIFIMIEFGKALLTEIFSGFFKLHQVIVIVVISIIIAFLFRPIERLSDKVFSSLFER